MSNDPNKLTADTESKPMGISRRKILQASGATIVAGGAFASTAAADDHLINVSPTAIELDCDNGDTGTFTVGIEGPPYGRTDVTVDGASASPASFRLAGDEASQTVTIGPVDEAEDVTIDATTPRGESQTATVAVTCVEEEEPPAEPSIENLEVTCDAITITTANIPEGEGLFAEVTVGDIPQAYTVPVGADGVTVIALPGDRDPSFLQVTYDGNSLFSGSVEAVDAPCEPPDDPRIDSVEVTCEQITITTVDIPGGTFLSTEVTFDDGSSQTDNVTVGEDGVAVIPLPGDRDPSFLQVTYDGDSLFSEDVEAVDAPCEEEEPEPLVTVRQYHVYEDGRCAFSFQNRSTHYIRIHLYRDDGSAFVMPGPDRDPLAPSTGISTSIWPGERPWEAISTEGDVIASGTLVCD